MLEARMTTIEIKKINRRNVYQLIYDERKIAKQEIAIKLQMGLSTVTQNLKLLEEENLIERIGLFQSTGGRRAQIIQIVRDARIAIGVGILKEQVLIVAVDLYGQIVKKASMPVAFAASPEYGTILGKQINQFIAENTLNASRILGVAIAVQGIITPDGKSVSYGAILQNTGMQLEDFARHIPYPSRLEHDSKAAAYLELWRKELSDATFLLLNNNMGGAVIVNQQVHHGINMHSGTLEHLCINPDGPLCYCGKRGCLETYCSADSLEHFSGLKATPFFEQLRAGNINCQKVWEDYLHHLALAIRNLNVIIDSNVILGGFLAPYFTQEDINRLMDQVRTISPFQLPEHFIFLSTHGAYAPATGAALFYVDRFLESL